MAPLGGKDGIARVIRVSSQRKLRASAVSNCLPLQSALLISQGGYQADFGSERFNSLTWFRNAPERCRSVGRVEDLSGNGKGTGFLVAGKDLHPRKARHVRRQRGNLA
jgi:hypothetical protein